MLTDKDIQDAVENCKWRKDLYGVWTCEGDIVPCLKHIDDGRCDTLIKLFAKEIEETNKFLDDLKTLIFILEHPVEIGDRKDTADTPQTEELKCRNKSYYESCKYEGNCHPIVCFKALDELQDALTDCDHKCVQTEVGCEQTDCQWK